jgi:hypothetical protein
MPVMGIAGNGKKDIARKNFARVNANPGKQTILISAQKFTACRVKNLPGCPGYGGFVTHKLLYFDGRRFRV